MNSKIYRCGWCGFPTDESGNYLYGNKAQKAFDIIEKYGDYRTHKTNGNCSHQDMNRNRVTRDMAIDAGDLSLEGQYI